MKFNKFFKLTYALLISVFGIAMFLCISCKHIINHNNQKTKLDYFDNMNTNKNYSEETECISKTYQYLKSKNIIYFPFNQYYILPIFFTILDIHADFLRKNPLYQIKIEGHTDERGTPEYNIGLGERRAYSVQKYFQSKGISSNQMKIISYGKEKPISFGHTEESYSKNRRVVIQY